ncbi:MAG: beta-lactamase family protein [Lachnospiraceae bacterium]|nr:beta-lactamase family protein [Lachnospiraceae bacterium]
MSFDISFYQLLYKIVAGDTKNISKVDYAPQKPRFENLPIEQPFERATPESQGIRSSYIRGFLKDIADEEVINPHHIMILRHGKVIAECSFAPYRRGMWHAVNSMSKSLTGMAVGIAVGEDKLSPNAKISEIFPGAGKTLPSREYKELAVKHLLTMTSGVDFAETGAVSGNNWLQGYLKAGFKNPPGTEFDYNSMNSYVLSAIIQEIYGVPMDEFIRERLFDPMGIKEFFWEHDPAGICKGGWGLFLKSEDAAKLGWLYMNKGVWNGEQLVPEHWVEVSLRSHADNGRFGYGCQIWMDDRPGSFAYNGLFGQNVICYPDTDMIICINAGDQEIFADGVLTRIRRKYFGEGFEPSENHLPEDPDEFSALNETIAYYENTPHMLLPEKTPEWGFRKRETNPVSIDEFISVLRGHYFELEQARTGLFPIVCQVMHNNYSEGIAKIGFDSVADTLFLLVKEGKWENRLKVGFMKAEISTVMLYSEPYLAGVTGKLSVDENGHTVLMLEIAFLEEACSRLIKIIFEGTEITVETGEVPGNMIINDVLRMSGDQTSVTKLPFVKNLTSGDAKVIIDQVVQSAMQGTDKGHLVM